MGVIIAVLLVAILSVLVVISVQLNTLTQETEQAKRNAGYIVNMLSILSGKKKD